jgi:hypothetical protein
VKIFSARIRTFVPIAASGVTLRACRSRWQLRIQRRGHRRTCTACQPWCLEMPAPRAASVRDLAGQVRVDWPLRHAAPGAPLVGVGWGSGLLGMTNAGGYRRPRKRLPTCEPRAFALVDPESGGDTEPSSQGEGRLTVPPLRRGACYVARIHFHDVRHRESDRRSGTALWRLAALPRRRSCRRSRLHRFDRIVADFFITAVYAPVICKGVPWCRWSPWIERRHLHGVRQRRINRRMGGAPRRFAALSRHGGR